METFQQENQWFILHSINTAPDKSFVLDKIIDLIPIVFTPSIRTPQLLTKLVLKSEQEQSTTWCCV